MTRLERVAGWLSDVFGIDTRSLAVFRIGLALTILLDLVLRAQDLGAHYTDAGVLPRALLAAEVGSRIPWAPVLLNLNPHFLFGGLIGQALVFVAAGATAVLLLVGWRTWWVTVASWILLASLHGRNPGVLNTGDVVLRMLLFWSMFLPLGARWSMDAARRSGWSPFRPRVVVGGAAAALLLQVGFIYAFNALFKTGAAWTTDFTALEMALGGETWASAWGQRLLEYSELLNVMTRFVIGLERYGLILGVPTILHRPRAHAGRRPVRGLPHRNPGLDADGDLPRGVHRCVARVPANVVMGEARCRRRRREPSPAPAVAGSGGARHPRLRLPLERRHRLGGGEAPRDVERPRVLASG